MRSRVRWEICLALFLLSGVRSAAAAEPAPNLLLHWQLAADIDDLMLTEEAFIYRDGLVVFKNASNFRVFLQRGVAAPALLQELRDVLAANKVGVQEAEDCKAASFLPTSASFAGVLTWFGKAARQNRMVYASAGSDPEPCEEEVNRILLAANVFLGEVDYNDVVETPPEE